MLRVDTVDAYGNREDPTVMKLDDELAYDSSEDMTHLVADDDYNEIGMPFDEAMEIQKLARREMLKRFLKSVPMPAGAAAELFEQHLDALIAAGYDEPDDVADLEEDEAARMGIKSEHMRILTTYAEEYETRLLCARPEIDSNTLHS